MMNPMQTWPQMGLTAYDLEALMPELAQYHALYAPLFQRREQAERCQQYLQGLLSEVDNKSVEAMVLARVGDDENAIRATQHFLGAGAWQDDAILERHRQQVGKELGDPQEGLLICDGSDFPKQGQGSAGVKRQWCGQLGKTANCQAGVFWAYASPAGCTLVDHRLYLPREWIEDEALAHRRTRCGVPADLAFASKPQLALQMLETILQEGSLPARWVLADEAFSGSPAFLDQIAAWGLHYFAEVALDTRVWRQRPATALPAYSGRGRRPFRERLLEDEPAALKVQQVADHLPACAWSVHTIKEGSKGPLAAELALLRVWDVRDQLPGQPVWLVLRRDLLTRELKAFLSNAPADTPQPILVRLTGMRWPIETCFEDSKQLLGMGQYQCRSWRGWHHHLTLVLLAHFFLLRCQIRLQDKAPRLTLPQVFVLLKAVLPRPSFSPQHVLRIVAYRDRRNLAAARSHWKRRLQQLKLVA